MTNLFMNLKPYGKEHFSVEIYEDGENWISFYTNGKFIVPDSDDVDDLDSDSDFWYRAGQELNLNKLRKLGRRLCRKHKEFCNIPLMRSCRENG